MAAVAVLAGGLAGCGGSSSSLPPVAAAQLQPRVAAIRAAATAGDPAGANAAAGELRRMVTALLASGDLSAKQATAILAAAAQVEAQLALLAPPAGESSTSTTTATTGEHPVKGKDKGKGKGHD